MCDLPRSREAVAEDISPPHCRQAWRQEEIQRSEKLDTRLRDYLP